MSDTLPEFLLARIAEDEEHAACKHDRFDCDLDQLQFFGDCSCGYPARVLAECEAKRRLLMFADDLARYPGQGGNAEILRAIVAVPYTDHPDYDEVWKQ